MFRIRFPLKVNLDSVQAVQCFKNKIKKIEFHVLDVSILVTYLVNRLYNLFRLERVKNKTTTKSVYDSECSFDHFSLSLIPYPPSYFSLSRFLLRVETQKLVLSTVIVKQAFLNLHSPSLSRIDRVCPTRTRSVPY